MVPTERYHEGSVFVVRGPDGEDIAILSEAAWCARVDDRKVISGIVYVLKNGWQWKDAQKTYGPHKTLYNRFRRWIGMGAFDRIFSCLQRRTTLPIR